MQDNPLISVVIPTFNRGRTIGYSLESVLAQTYGNLEIVVVDDCSRDDTVEIVRNSGDHRVKCIALERHAGAQGARNRGILEASGDWIAFQDSDDEWLPGKLEQQVSQIEKWRFDPKLFVYCDAFRHDRNTGVRSVRLCPAINGEGQYSTLLQGPGPLFPTILTSRQALASIGYLDEGVPSFQEWDTSIRLARSCRAVHVAEPLMTYYVGAQDAISCNAARHVEGLHYIINKYQSDITQICGEMALRDMNMKLLGTCLDLHLMDYFDRYVMCSQLSGKLDVRTFYLRCCRLLGMRPNNVVYRALRRLLGVEDPFALRQGRIVSEEMNQWDREAKTQG